MATLQDLLNRKDELEKAIAPEREVHAGDKSVVYRSHAELRDQMSDVERQIRAASSPGPVRMIRVTSSKGF